MEKLKALWAKLNPRVALISGVVVISTSMGTCHLMSDEGAEQSQVEAEGKAEAEEPKAPEQKEEDLPAPAEQSE
tara:strand:+ start:642 stop:863 length:222 start_codon:yes stop_codon:yes gene_type:complete